MQKNFLKFLQNQTDEVRQKGLFKEEREITSPQQAEIRVRNGQKVLNFCSNNYLGLANNPDIINCSQRKLDHYGFGLSFRRFICGTQTIHHELEKKIFPFLKTEDTILYISCLDANGGLFETILGPEDAVISDALNHASIIDGIRLCKAKSLRYNNNDMADLEEKLKEQPIAASA